MGGAATKQERPSREAFGAANDLDLDFVGAPRPELVTALLAGGGKRKEWWMRPVGDRIAALLRLYLSHHRGETELSARCSRAECGQTFGFVLPVAELASLPPPPERSRVRLADGRSVTLRRPLGADLRHWRDARPASREAAARAMLNALTVEGRAEPGDEEAIAEAMIACDPLAALTVEAECPACGHRQSVAVDLEGFVLAYFARRQQALLHDIHRLASHYGWTEEQALAVPPARRVAYLALIDGEAT
jgi:hypothetical protein